MAVQRATLRPREKGPAERFLRGFVLPPTPVPVRGRPREWSDERVLVLVLTALLRGGGWSWRGSRTPRPIHGGGYRPPVLRRMSGSACLRRLRSWQATGYWEQLVEAWRAEGRGTADGTLLRVTAEAARHRARHTRPSRSGAPGRSESERGNDRAIGEVEDCLGEFKSRKTPQASGSSRPR